ncbi:hypothetical protein HUJ04_013056 [Dendroctonus ponderosae]
MCDNRQSDLDLWVADFAKKRKISKYQLVHTENTSKGDGYLGVVTFVNVLAENGELYNLVIKSAKKGKELRKQTPIQEVFLREMFIYSKVLPTFQDFQLEHAVNTPFENFAKCYTVCREIEREALILQNLKPLNYEVYDRKKPQNLDHALVVFKGYGKFHALSLALKKQKPALYEDLTRGMSDLMAQFLVQAHMEAGFSQDMLEALDMVRKDDEKSYRKLELLQLDAVEKYIYKIEKPDDGLSVILHGDCWNNNMMFTYGNSANASKSKPTDVKFLDFQLSSVGSPIYDLSYYLYAVADEKLLKYHDLLLQAYHHSLTSFLEKFHETSYNIALEDIRRHWKEFGKFGLLLAPTIIRIELSETEEVVDLAERAESGNIADAFSGAKIKNRAEFEERVKAVFKHFASLL